MTQTLNDKLNAADELGLLKKEVPDYIVNNLASQVKLRPYQLTALERFLYYIEDYPDRPRAPQLLFHMATGSGKTVLMASLILDLYKRGYRNFLFFVNSAQIIEKTKENFLNPWSAKHLFANEIRVDDRVVEVRSVDTFDAVSEDAINIHFTTIQGLHSKMQAPKENSVTIEDFRDFKVAMISDEAHHLNAETKKSLTKVEQEVKASWEATVSSIFLQNNENILLEFTATVDLSHEAISQKYSDKILYDYDLKQFREDGYSKDIELRQADLPAPRRMLQAVILSQYRRKVAEAHGIHCKPIILMKSKTIKESQDNEAIFCDLIESLSPEDIQELKSASDEDSTLSTAFSYIMNERGMSADSFIHELKGDFASEKLVNVNNTKDLEQRQIELNALEEPNNEIRIIFAVDKLNEGWDVLNLFDIVRLYDTRDGKENKVGKTTMAEAQLIGRGARYFPFSSPDLPDAPREKRKYDHSAENPLRILEELHYHCSHNPKYIHDIRNALRETGMLDESSRTVQLNLKDKFKESEFYKKGIVWTNSKIKNPRDKVVGLESYNVDCQFKYPALMTGSISERDAFDDSRNIRSRRGEPVSREFRIVEFGKHIVRFALDSNPFYNFQNLKSYFPKLDSIDTFINNNSYLAKLTVLVEGLPNDLDTISSKQKLLITQYVLRQIEHDINSENVEYIGSKEFKPYPIHERFTDRTLKLSIKGEVGLSWVNGESYVPGTDQIDLLTKDWFAYNDSYGTDQEKLFIKFLNDHAERLGQIYDEFFLLRNEKAVKLYNFEDGKTFEPDFVLFGKENSGEKEKVMQIFIEPKGEHLAPKDQWKNDFLCELKENVEVAVVFQGKDYTVIGLPFFNDSPSWSQEFRAHFEKEALKQ